MKFNGIVFEPCVGKGDILVALMNHSSADNFLCNDADKTITADFHLDARLPESWEVFGLVDWVVTNPPFDVAFDILKLAHQHTVKGIALLLRLSFLEPVIERAVWLAGNPPQREYILPRISFTGDGNTDSVTCAWMVWDKHNKECDIQIVIPEIQTFM